MGSLFKEQSMLSRETIQNEFLQNYAPILTYTFYPLSSTPHRSIGICMQCSCSSKDIQFPLLTLSQTSMVFRCLRYKSFENTVGKGEIARNKQFLLFPQCFLPIWRTVIFIKFQNCRT